MFLGGLVFGPQGFGLQGSSSMTGAIAKNAIIKNTQIHALIYSRNGFSLHAVKGSPM